MNIRDLPGLKKADLVSLGNCAICNKKLFEVPGVTFYRLKIDRFALSPDEIRREAGLEMHIGPLASVMGPNNDLAKLFDGPKTVMVHEQCAMDSVQICTLMMEGEE